MKLIQILLASTFAIAAAGTFAAKAEKPKKEEEKVVVSPQEQPATATENAVAKPASAQLAEETSAVETAAEKTSAAKPAQ